MYNFEESLNYAYKYPENDPNYKGQKISIQYTNGPSYQRGCTDVFMLILFIAFWIGMIIISVFAFKNGNPELLVIPYDAGGYCLYLLNFKFLYDIRKPMWYGH